LSIPLPNKFTYSHLFFAGCLADAPQASHTHPRGWYLRLTYWRLVSKIYVAWLIHPVSQVSHLWCMTSVPLSLSTSVTVKLQIHSVNNANKSITFHFHLILVCRAFTMTHHYQHWCWMYQCQVWHWHIWQVILAWSLPLHLKGVGLGNATHRCYHMIYYKIFLWPQGVD